MGRFEEEELRSQQDALRNLANEIASRQVVARSEDGLVEVTAIASGQIIGLEIDPRVFRNPDSKGLASAILATLSKATEMAANIQLASLEQITGVGAGTLGGLFEGAKELAEELTNDADEIRRRS
jgi:DNA-binding protein YbaB